MNDLKIIGFVLPFLLYITGDLFGLLTDCNESDKHLNVTFLKWRAPFLGISYFDALKFKDAMNCKDIRSLWANFWFWNVVMY